MSAPSERIVLAERGGRGAYAVVLDGEVLRVEGGARLARRRAAYRRVYGLERAGAWLWVGAGLVPVVLGGDDVPSEQLARLEAALRTRLAALPDGADRLARIAARRSVRLRFPWLTATLGLGFVLASSLGAAPEDLPRFATNLLLLASVGLLAEPWLGSLRVLASGTLALLVANAGAGGSIGFALAPLAPALGWAGSLAFTRLRREAVLGVRFRSALDGGALLGLALAAHALSSAPGGAGLLLAGLAGFGVAPLLLRDW